MGLDRPREPHHLTGAYGLHVVDLVARWGILEAEGLSFSALVDEERKRRALHRLRSQELTVEAIGERLGYQNVANFTRAFRRWTGKTPSAYRNGEGSVRR